MIVGVMFEVVVAALVAVSGMAVSGRDPAAARDLADRRDSLRSPYYSGS